jgi:hypothetical protein
MSEESTEVVERDTAGRFVTSGNKRGRPKGSKNRVTLLKLMAEEAVRERNIERMQQVCDEIIEDALMGDKDMRKLVWQAMISKGSADEKSQAQEKVEIKINTAPKEEVVVIEQQPIEEIIDEQQESDE